MMSQSPKCDAESDLLVRHWRGDVTAFPKLVEEFGPVLFSLFRRSCSNHHDADDLTQGLFVHLLRRSRNYEARGNLRGYLLRVADRFLIDEKKKQNRLRSTVLLGELIDVLQDQRPPNATLHAEVSAILASLMKRRPLLQQVVSLLVDDCSRAQLQKLLGLSEYEVRAAIDEIREAMAHRMKLKTRMQA